MILQYAAYYTHAYKIKSQKNILDLADRQGGSQGCWLVGGVSRSRTFMSGCCTLMYQYLKSFLLCWVDLTSLQAHSLENLPSPGGGVICPPSHSQMTVHSSWHAVAILYVSHVYCAPEDYPWVTEAHPRDVETHPGVTEAHPNHGGPRGHFDGIMETIRES